MADLISLSQGRWFIPILGEARRLGGMRSAPVRDRLGMSRSMMTRSLEKMVEEGWLVRNPGQGHPLRPEYLVGKGHEDVARACERIVAERQRIDLSPGGPGKWHLPLLAAVARDRSRFVELEERLDPVTPRALSSALKVAIKLGHVERQVEASFPPVADYSIGDRARRLADAALEIVAA